MSIFPTKTLLATDGSEGATLAAQTAAELAEKTGSELHAVYVRAKVAPHYPGYYIGPGMVEDAQEKEQENLARQAQRLLDTQVEEVRAAGGRVVEAHLCTGRPDAEIIKLTEEIGAGLIVIGSRGRGGIRRALMGSVSTSVVRHAHCPVLVVRAGENGQQAAPSLQRILLATDGSGEATLALQAATEIATKMEGSELHLVHIGMPHYDPSYFEDLYIEDFLQGEEEELRRQAQDLLNEQVKRVEAAGGRVTKVHSRVGIPEVEITGLAEEIGADLVAVGSRGLGGMRRALIGSVSDSVVWHAHCPILVVREDKR